MSVALLLSSRDFLLQHIAAMRSSVVVKSKTDQANLAVLDAELQSLAKSHLRVARIRMVTFVFLYASVLSNFALPALTTIVEPFTLVANLVGVGILSLVALYLTWRLGQLWNRMTVVGSHVITIYEKHSKAVYPVKHGRFRLEKTANNQA